MYDFDARCFYDPNRRCHAGWQPEIIHGVVSKNMFRRWLKGVRSRIKLALKEDVVVPVFLFYCNKGRHRSVATATAVGHILVKVTSSRTGRWRRRSRCGGGERGRGRGSQRGCARCGNAAEKKIAV